MSKCEVRYEPDPERIRPAPCERFGGCIHRERCATEKLACGAFAMYTGSVRKGMPTYWPTRERYLAIFEEDTDD